MADRLEALLNRFSVVARVFHSGPLCGINDLDDARHGHLHLIREGVVEVHNGNVLAVQVTRPSLLLYPRPMPHRFVTDAERGAEMTCAELEFEGGAANPLAATLPPFACFALEDLRDSEPLLAMLFDEAFEQRCGRQAVINRLFEVVMIQVLRHLMEQGQARSGMLAGLSHPRLRHALIAMHEQPAQGWSLDALAERAGMSRSVFAGAFRATVGDTPGAYLQQWRITLVQQALRKGRSLKLVAGEVGYGSEAALSRAFKGLTGLSPREWKRTSATTGREPPPPQAPDVK